MLCLPVEETESDLVQGGDLINGLYNCQCYVSICRKHVLDACMYSRLIITQNKQFAQDAAILSTQLILSSDATSVLRLTSFLLIK